jgi:hypothetical protein
MIADSTGHKRKLESSSHSAGEYVENYFLPDPRVSASVVLDECNAKLLNFLNITYLYPD